MSLLHSQSYPILPLTAPGQGDARGVLTPHTLAPSSPIPLSLHPFAAGPSLSSPFPSPPLGWTSCQSSVSRVENSLSLPRQADTHTHPAKRTESEKHAVTHSSTMPQRGTRGATHAGSWYDSRPEVLSRQLDGFLEKVPTTVDGKQLPVPKSRVIIAPWVPSCPPQRGPSQRLIAVAAHPLPR